MRQISKKSTLTLVFGLVVAGIFAVPSSLSQVREERSARSIEEEQDYAFAYGLFKDGLYQMAAEQLDRFVQKYPDSPKRIDALYLGVESRYQQGHYDTAVRGFLAFTAEYPDSRLADDAYFRLGESYFRVRQHYEAVAAFKTVLDRFQTSELAGEAAYWTGESYAEVEEFENAQKYFLLAYENYPDGTLRDYAAYSVGWTYQRRSRYEKAIEWYDKLLSEFPESHLAEAARVRKGECLFGQRSYQQSIDYLMQIRGSLKGETERGDAEYMLGEAYYQLNRFSESERQLRSFLTTFPSHRLCRDAWYALGWTFLKQGSYPSAAVAFDSAAVDGGALAQVALFRRGVAEKFDGQRSRAYDTWSDLRTRYPDGEYADNALYEIGLMDFEAGRIDSAKSVFELLLQQHRTSDVLADTYRMLGECLLAERRFKDAAKEFERSLSVESASADVRIAASYQHAWSLYKSGELLQAAREFSAFLNSYGSHPRAHEARFWMAESDYQLGNYGAALRGYKSVLSVSGTPKREEALYGAGWSHFKLGEYDKALPYFQDLVAAYAGGQFALDARLRIGDCMYYLKQYEQAAGAYRAVIRFFPTSTSVEYAKYQLAQSSFKAERLNDAVSQFQALISDHPSSELADDARYAIGWIWFENKQYQEAITEFEAVIRNYPQTETAAKAWYSIGDAYYNLNKVVDAEAAYRKVVTDYPQSPYVSDAVTGIQYCLVAQGKQSDAANLIDEFIANHPSTPMAETMALKKADLFYNQEDYGAAAAEYRAFSEKYPDSRNAPFSLFWAGKSLSAAGRLDEAAQMYELAAIAPRASESVRSDALLAAGALYRQLGKFEEALTAFSRVERIQPGSEASLQASFQKGLVYVDNGGVLEAKNQFEQILNDHPGSSVADGCRLALAHLFYAQSNPAAAMDYARIVSTSRTDSLGADALFLIGTIHLDRKDWESAITTFIRMRYVYPNEELWMAKSHLGLGSAYEKLNERRRAREAYEAVLRYTGQSEAVAEARRRLAELDRTQ